MSVCVSTCLLSSYLFIVSKELWMSLYHQKTSKTFFLQNGWHGFISRKIFLFWQRGVELRLNLIWFHFMQEDSHAPNNGHFCHANMYAVLLEGFDCCVFQPAIWCTRTWKLVEILFFSPYQPFFFFLNIFHWFSFICTAKIQIK